LTAYDEPRKNIERKISKEKEVTKMKNQHPNGTISIMNIIRLFLIGFLTVSVIISLTLYASASLIGYMTINSWWMAWGFTLIGLCGMPLALAIDGVTGIAYESWGTPKTKMIFLFIGKTLEGLLLIGIVHQADEWLKGVTCSTWSELIIGYSIFLFLEALFAYTNRLKSHAPTE
jgi:hypothetical protein